jgi:hypothetical protein
LYKLNFLGLGNVPGAGCAPWGRWTLPEGVRTEVISASILPGDDIAGYDPAQDRDLYEYFLADEQE